MTDILNVQPPLAIAELQKPGTIFSVEGKRLIWRGELGDGELDIQDFDTGQLHRPVDPSTGIRQVAKVRWLQDAMAAGKFEVLVDADGTPHRTERVPTAEMDREEILGTDPYAEARETLLRDLHAAGVARNDPDLSTYVDGIWSERLADRFGERPATSTVRTWMTWTDPEIPAISQLMSGSGRVERAKRLDPLVQEVVAKRCQWYWDQRGRKIKDAEAAGTMDVLAINRERRAEGLPELKAPSREAYRRAVRASECRENFERKFGPEAAKRYWAPSGRGATARRALEVVYMDDTVFDVVACIQSRGGHRFPAGRPYFCAAVCGTRCVPGFVLSFKPPTTHTAAECLKRVGREKVHISGEWSSRYPVLRQIAGKPDSICVDNGSNYVSAAFQDACAESGIVLIVAPVGAPKAKAIVERFFHTLKTWLLEKLPGHTLDPKTLRELGIDPETKAVLLVEELEALIQEFLNVYHVSIHSGINEQPAAAWLRSIQAHPRAVLDENAINRMTHLTIHGRRLTTNGVRWKRNTYRIGDLPRLLDACLPGERMRSRLDGTAAATVKIKIDPEDVGHIWVFDPLTRSYVELLATHREYAAGLTLDQHEQALAWAKRRNLAFNTEEERMAAVHGLNEFIEASIPSLSARERRVMARTMQAPLGEVQPDMPIHHADGRHDGRGEIIQNDAPDGERLDSNVPPSRPASGLVAEGGSHDADPRTDGEDVVFDVETGLFVSPEDEDERFEEDYA